MFIVFSIIFFVAFFVAFSYRLFLFPFPISFSLFHLSPSPFPPTPISPENLPIEILYEDADVVVPAKPANMPTHPSHNHRGDTLADALAYKYQEDGVPFVFRAISRLDRNTSGILLIAKDRISASRLSASMKSGNINKKYVAILDGELSSDEGIIDTYIKREAESIIFRKVCAENEGGDGIVKIIVGEHREIVGVHMIGSYASEIIYGAAAMVAKKERVEDVRKLVFPHPTVCEVIREEMFSI